MKDSLQKLKEEIFSTPAIPPISDGQWQQFCDQTVVVLMTGGEGKRFRSVSGSSPINKNSYKLPNGDSLIEMTIRLYRQAGLKNFAALVYHQSDSIVELLGSGQKLGVKIKYSFDPNQAVGKGGAILNALNNQVIPPGKNFIVHNPDDVIVNFPGSFPRYLAAGHLANVERGALATVVVVPETAYTFTGMKIKDGKITQIEMYPLIPVPTHIGVTVFSAEAGPYFTKYFDLTHKADFEKILFPILCEEQKLFAISIPGRSWLAVNNEKTWEELVKLLEGQP